MSDPVDVYADQFQVNMGPYGCVLNFHLSGREPVAPGAAQPTERVASVRMSLEHLKLMTFILRRHLTTYEQQASVRVQLPQVVLNALQIGREDWNECWREG